MKHPLQGISYRRAEKPAPTAPRYTESPTLGEAINTQNPMDILFTVFGPEIRQQLSPLRTKTGAVVTVTLTRDMIEHLDAYENGMNFLRVKGLRTRDLRAGARVIVKLVIAIDSKLKRRRVTQNEIKREITIHDKLWNKTKPTILFDKTYDIRKVIPEFYYGAYNGDFGITIMQILPGMTLHTSLERPAPHIPAPIPRVEDWMIVKLEYALCCLYLAGYVHADLHANNIHVDFDTQHVYIMDFGRSITMTREMIKEFQMYLIDKKDKALTEFWKNHMQNYGNAAIYARATKMVGIPLNWWSNVEVLKKINTPGRHQLHKLREKTWIPINPRNRPAPTPMLGHKRQRDYEDGELPN